MTNKDLNGRLNDIMCTLDKVSDNIDNNAERINKIEQDKEVHETLLRLKTCPYNDKIENIEKVLIEIKPFIIKSLIITVIITTIMNSIFG